jgi:hypothetical protein
MSNGYLLCPIGPTDWSLGLDAHLQAIADRWSQAEVCRGVQPAEAVMWELALGDDLWIDGSVDVDGQVCYLRGSPELLTDYVLWFRAEHHEPDLVLVHDDGGELHTIFPTTTRQEVLSML